MASLVERLNTRALDDGRSTALVFQNGDGARQPVTTSALDEQARVIAVALRKSGVRPGDRVLLSYPPGLDYVAGFLGCLYAGVVAVPVFPPGDARGFERVRAITRDAGAEVALTDAASLDAVRDRLAVTSLCTTDIDRSGADGWSPAPPGPSALAFLQYTSGSTGTPKGVMVTHGNLAHNSAVIASALHAGPDTKAVSWLPPYHDMGLIGGILQPLYSGFPCLLMPPATFLYRPLRWLQAISEFGATSTAAPDFAYAECVRRVSDVDLADLDLSRLEHAMVGAEPVRAATLDAFAEKFAPAGFRRMAFLPCYGLAESTLFVTGADAADSPVERGLDRDALARDEVVYAADGVGNIGCGHTRGVDRVAVVDPTTGDRCAPATVGEVWVHGPSVAAGYWGDEERTAATFGADLAGEPGWLRTGDLGFLDDAELHITGRLKDLIVVRGANHYPQDVELVAEQAHPAVLPGRSAAFGLDDGTGERVVLVAEAAKNADLAAAIDAVTAAVATAHGIALHEVVLVRRGSVPRTSSGKVRRRECRSRYLDGSLPVLATTDTDTEPVAATGHSRLLALVADVLDRDPGLLDPTRPLVGQGLDSLRAARLRAALATELNADVDLAELLSTLTIDDLAGAPKPVGSVVPRLSDDVAPPASLGQERLWLLDELGAGVAYHVTGVVWLAAEPDPSAAEAALRVLVTRHEQLRTGIDLGADGSLRLTIGEDVDITVPVLAADSREHCLDLVRDWRRTPFRLTDPPLLRAALYRVGAARTEWALALCAHHGVCDGWSFGVLAREFGAAYTAIRSGAAPALPDLPVRYRDFAAWQREQADGEAAVRGLDFWRDALTGATPPELGAGEGVDPFAGDALPVRLPADLVAGLRQVALASGTTLFVVLVAAMGTVLGRWSARTDVVMGTVGAGRWRPELTGIVGFLATTLPLRIDLAGNPTVLDLVTRTREMCLDAQRNQDVPFERIVREVNPGRDTPGLRPLVRHVLVLQDEPPVLDVGGTEVTATVLAPDGARFDLELDLTPASDGGLSGVLGWAEQAFDRLSATRLLAELRVVLEAFAREPACRLSALPALPAQARELILGTFSGVAVAPVGTPSVPDWFATTVADTPDAVAVIDTDGRATTYADLASATDRLAGRLRSLGVREEDRVGVCLHRGTTLSVAVLGILKAGAAYLPLDPGYPAQRVELLVFDAAPGVVLSTSDLAHLVPPGQRVVLLDEDSPDETVPAPRITPASAAYVLYTSGSTGRPKGAVNTHAALTNRLHWARSHHPVGPGDRVLHKTPIGFDVSVWELLLPLVTGATLVHARADGHRDPHYLHDLLAREDVTVCHFVPSMLRAFLDVPSVPLPHLRTVVCSGEELTSTLAQRFLDRFPGVELQNLYGPTEAAIDVSAQRVTAPVPSRVSIGGPVPGARLYVLDGHLRPQPVGVPGELFIGGVQLARGYQGSPALTADRFVPNPFAAGERIYATGDRARWRADGTLDYLGRLDHQLKIRGQRVEPAEIEAALETHPEVSAAVVVADRNERGETYLVGYVATGDARPDHARLRDHLLDRVPSALVPGVFVVLASFPLLTNGKVDRKALPKATPTSVRTYVAPTTDAQRAIAAIFANVLELDRIGVHDGFFELGGHSLLAIKVISRVRAELGVELAVADLLTGRPTVEGLAGLVESHQLDSAGDLDALLDQLDDLPEEEVLRLLSDG